MAHVCHRICDFSFEPQRKTTMAGHTHQQYDTYTNNYAQVHEQLALLQQHLAAFPDPFADDFEFDHEKTIELRDLGIAMEGIKEMFKIVGEEG